MNPTIGDFHIAVREVDLARPDALLKVSEFGRVFTLVHRLARPTQQQENRGGEHVHDPTHEEKSRQMVLIRRLSKILPKISSFLCVIGDHEVRKDRQVEVPIVQESSFPVHQPYALSVKKDVLRLHIVVARHHVRVVTRVNGGPLGVSSETFLNFVLGKNVRGLKPPDEAGVNGVVIQCFGKRRSACRARSTAGIRTSASVTGKGTASTKSVMEIPSSMLVYQTRVPALLRQPLHVWELARRVVHVRVR